MIVTDSRIATQEEALSEDEDRAATHGQHDKRCSQQAAEANLMQQEEFRVVNAQLSDRLLLPLVMI